MRTPAADGGERPLDRRLLGAHPAEQWARINGQYEREELARSTDDLGRSTGTGSARWRRDYYVSPDELRVLGTGEAIVSVAPVHQQPRRLERVLVAQPRGDRATTADGLGCHEWRETVREDPSRPHVP